MSRPCEHVTPHGDECDHIAEADFEANSPGYTIDSDADDAADRHFGRG